VQAFVYYSIYHHLQYQHNRARSLIELKGIVGSGKDTIVMLHGGPGFNMEYFAPDEEPLAASFVLLFYDQRGNGRSSLISDSL
jgi:pimeloyl-ACP methyl ester carboxylesterase